MLLWGSNPLNIHEVWPRPKWGEEALGRKSRVDHFIGHVPLLYKKVIKGKI